VENRLKFLKENLEREHQKLNYITLYVWVGTCNLTTKEGNYIYLTAKDHTAVGDIKKGLREIYSFTREFGNRVKLVFLHLPLYSIVQFNLYNEYEGDMTDFVEEDKVLQQQITEVNFFINDTNRLFHATTQKISDDLQKSKRRNPFSPTKHKYDFSLYKDGIHPTDVLAKLWLVRITRLVKNDCYKI